MDSIWKPTRNTAAEALFLCAAGMLVAGLAGVATGGKLSFLRLALLGGALLLSAGFAFLARQTQTNSRLVDWWNDHIQQKTLTFLLGATALIFLSGWVLLWTPLENFGKFYYYALGGFSLPGLADLRERRHADPFPGGKIWHQLPAMERNCPIAARGFRRCRAGAGHPGRADLDGILARGGDETGRRRFLVRRGRACFGVSSSGGADHRPGTFGAAFKMGQMEVA